MPTINSNVVLRRSFDRLKESLDFAEKGKNENGEYGYAYGYGVLRAAIKSHILYCTGENLYTKNIPAANPDDLKEVNI